MIDKTIDDGPALQVFQGQIPLSALATLVLLHPGVSGPAVGLQWGLIGQLEDLNFADELTLISETIKHLQDKTNRLVKQTQVVERGALPQSRSTTVDVPQGVDRAQETFGRK